MLPKLMKFSFLPVLLLISAALMAQQPETLPLWPAGQIPHALTGHSVQEKTETGTDGIVRISGVTEPTLTVYLPKKRTASTSAVMICPGGGYWILASGHEGEEMARWFNELGMVAAVLKYRLPDDKIASNKHLVPLTDAMQGIKLLRQNASRWGIDPARIGVMGFSAGGHLASTLSTHYADPVNGMGEIAKPNFALLLYPVVTFGDKAHTGSRDKLLGPNAAKEQIDYFSNELQVTAQTPPTFLVHSQDDKGVPAENSINYFLALKNAGVPAELHLYPTGGHGYALRTKGKGSVENWPEACKAWLKSMKLLSE